MPTKIILASPFDATGTARVQSVNWKINHWMKTGPLDAGGIGQQFHQIERFLHGIYDEVVIMPYPDTATDVHDIIFAANHFACISDVVFLANMTHPVRQQERPFVTAFLDSQGIPFVELPADIRFEGSGDFIQSPEHNVGFTGERTDAQAFEWIHSKLRECGITPKSFTLIHTPEGSPYYHGDLKFKPLPLVCPISQKRYALIAPIAFSKTDYFMLRDLFELIDVNETEADRFAINSICGTDKHSGQLKILLPDGCPNVAQALSELGIDTYPLHLATKNLGGGPWCMVNEIRDVRDSASSAPSPR